MLESLTNRTDSFVDDSSITREEYNEYVQLQRKRMEQLAQNAYDDVDALMDGDDEVEDDFEDYCNYRMNNKGE